MIATHDLEAGFHSLRAGVAEEHTVRESHIHESVRQSLGLGYAKEVGAVPDLLRLFLQGSDQLRMAMSKAVDSDAHGEVQVALACGGKQITTLAVIELELRIAIVAHQCGSHGSGSHEKILAWWSWCSGRASRSGFVIQSWRVIAARYECAACSGLDRGAIMPYRGLSFKPPGLSL